MAALFGKRLRRGAATTALAAAAVAALSASQAPSLTDQAHHKHNPNATSPDGQSATGDSPYYTDLPPLGNNTPPSTSEPPVGGADAGIPATVLDAYKRAADSIAGTQPSCHLPWELLAAIGKVESGHANGGQVDANGNPIGSPILGPVLDGHGFAKVADTDGGLLDSDPLHDRAVGPMQFIPSTWSQGGPTHQGWGADGNGDGKKDPNNVYDAALAAGHYLCASGRDLSDTAQLHEAILAYNHSDNYLNTVLSWYDFYRKGSHEVPNGTGVPPRHRSDQPAGSTPGAPGTSGGGSNGASTGPGSPNPGQSGTGGSQPGGTGGTGGTGGAGGSSTGGSGGSATGGSGSGGSQPGNPPGGSHPGGTADSGGTGSGGTSTGGTGSSDGTGAETPASVAHLKVAGTGTLTATAGQAFAQRVVAHAEDAKAQPVARARVTFAIVGATDATFAGGATRATVQTDGRGDATAPVLQAGETTGDFMVRATAVGTSAPPLDFKATVTERQADKLVLKNAAAPTAAQGAEFADDVVVQATFKGAAAPRVAASATLIKAADDPTENDKGPYFKDDAGKPVRALRGLQTDADGQLKLPKLYADGATGTFLLRIITSGGATLDVKLTVSAASPSS